MAASIALTEKPAERTSGHRLARCLLTAGAGIAALWLLGFGWFLYLAAREAPPPPHVDAIVVLTGGPERVDVALRLLAGGTADRLLVSGAGEKTDLAILAHRAGIDPAPLERQITLGHAARSTRGNALETAAWTREHGIDSLLVVTSWFHMPRALVELRRAMPAVTIASLSGRTARRGRVGPCRHGATRDRRVSQISGGAGRAHRLAAGDCRRGERSRPDDVVAIRAVQFVLLRQHFRADRAGAR